jgi:hypothetical protein
MIIRAGFHGPPRAVPVSEPARSSDLPHGKPSTILAGSSNLPIEHSRPAEPAILDDGMTRADIIDLLRWLQFPHKCRCLIELDRGVRDFLVGVLRDRSPAKP